MADDVNRESFFDEIEAGLDAVEGKAVPDEIDVLEISNLEDDKIRLELDKLREQIAGLKTDRELRKQYGDRILRFLEWYAGVVGSLVLLSGFSFTRFNLPETAMVALVGSTAIAAIGLVGFVAKGLFDKSSSN